MYFKCQSFDHRLIGISLSIQYFIPNEDTILVEILLGTSVYFYQNININKLSILTVR